MIDWRTHGWLYSTIIHTLIISWSSVLTPLYLLIYYHSPLLLEAKLYTLSMRQIMASSQRMQTNVDTRASHIASSSLLWLSMFVCYLLRTSEISALTQAVWVQLLHTSLFLSVFATHQLRVSISSSSSFRIYLLHILAISLLPLQRPVSVAVSLL